MSDGLDKHHPSTIRWIVVITIVLVVILAINLFESPKKSDSDKSNQSLSQPNPTASPYQTTLPYRRADNEYAGSSSCKECHTDEHKSWHDSYHRSMTQIMSPESVKASFNGQSLSFEGERFTMHKRNGEYWTTIESIEATKKSPNGKDPNAIDVRMGMVTGSHHMQVFWLPGMMGNLQIGFPFAWLIEDKRWAPRNSLFIRDPHTVISKENWNMNCIRCHTTGPKPKPNQEAQRFESQVADLGISCEACHGPGQQHVDRQISLAVITDEDRKQALASESLSIIQPADLDHKRSTQVCGSCHGMKWFDKSENWTEEGFRYRPGDDLTKTTPIIQPSKADKQEWLKPVLEKNPEILADFFWEDGKIRVTGREYNGLLESPCHQRGTMSCVSCHSMHKSDPNDQLARGMRTNQACLQCHKEMGDNITAHTLHAANSAGSNCYNCHMPHTSYGLLKAIRSHTIETPNVATTLKTGRPNACNLCHLDKTLDWTAEHLAKRTNKPKTNVPNIHKTTAASAVWLLNGDAGQRALAAWHMGWEPALLASGTGWQSPMLADSLNDPYSAVRYIANKALLKQPGFDSFKFDFVADEVERIEKQKKAMEIWLNSEKSKNPVPSDTILLNDQGLRQNKRVQDLISTRNNRPMRLRE
ncbi:MAG: cytochrome c3 family protein [Verrucomicrobiota bacterium]|nr:cytochrome c3 family protein [Verrucomicrobiota bacterium]